MNKYWLNTSFIYLFIVALLGTILRLTGITTLGINYNHFLHAHSHIAFLGWLYNTLFIIFIYTFLNPKQRANNSYRLQFWLTQAANVGMLLSFPIQGYGLYSISFSTLHIFISFWFAYSFLQDANSNPENFSRNYWSFKFIKIALAFMILSSLGPFSLGPIIATTGTGSELYYNAIYFYLHFQYNGWFSFAVIGLFFRILENKQIFISEKKVKIFYRLMLLSCVPAYLLSVLWTKPPIGIYVIAKSAALIQSLGLIVLLSIIVGIKDKLKTELNKWGYFLLSFSFFVYSIKIVLQLTTSFPYFADLAYQIRGFTIGYLHLVLIGYISIFLFAFLIENGIFYLNKTTKTGLTFFISGFVMSEIIIFAQAIFAWLAQNMIPHYYSLLVCVSLLMVLGTALLINNSPIQKKP